MNALMWIQPISTMVNVEGRVLYLNTSEINIDLLIETHNIENLIVAQSGLSKDKKKDFKSKEQCSVSLLPDLEVINKISSKDNELTAILSYGSSYAYSNGSEFKRYCGYGYLLDDLGNIYDLGKRLLKHYVRYIELGEENTFTQKCEQVLNINKFNSEDFIYDLYNKGIEYVVSFAEGFKSYSDSIYDELINNYCEEIVDYMYFLVKQNKLSKINVVGELLSFKQVEYFFSQIALISIIDETYLTYGNYSNIK